MNLPLLIPVSLMVAFSFSMKRLNKSWLAPPTFFSTLWTFFVIAPICFAPSFPVHSYGIWVILLFMIAVGVGSIFGDQYQSKTIVSEMESQLVAVFQIMPIITSILTILSLGGIILLFFFGISRFSLSNSLIDFLILPNQFSMDRYAGVVVMPISIRLLMYLLYPASLMGGITYNQVNNRWLKYFMVLPIVLSIGYAFLLTTRSTILLSIILWMSGLLSAKVLKNDKVNEMFNVRSVITYLFAIGGFTGIFILTAWLRDAGGEIFIDTIVENVRAYFFGYLSSFTQWVQSYVQNNLLFGIVTFAGPADLLGLTERQLGFYNEISILGTSHTNIFTALRGVIHDFSILGGFLFFSFFGFIATLALNQCRQKKIFWIIPLSAFYAFTIYSPLISIFNYNSILFSWILLGGTIFTTPIIKRFVN